MPGSVVALAVGVLVMLLLAAVFCRGGKSKK